MKIKPVANMSIGTITWPFAMLGKSLTLHLGRVSAANLERAKFHGLGQKVGDAMAINAKKHGGRVPLQLKYDAAKAVVDFLELGGKEWNMVRTGTAKARGEIDYLPAAMKLAYPNKTEARILEYIEGLTASEQLAHCKNAKIAPFIKTLMEAAIAHIDTDSMLDEFGDESETDSEDADGE